MDNFHLKYPEIQDPEQIEQMSLQAIMTEAKNYPAFLQFTESQQKVIQRMIHSTTCFENIIDNIYFSNSAIERIKSLIHQGATIITDTNMIKIGINTIYTQNYNNKVLCCISEPVVKEIAKNKKTTRTVIAVQKALDENRDVSLILACGNAPTYIYAAIEKIIQESFDLNKIALIAFPVGFINVVESKEYAMDFLNSTKAEGIIIKGRYGGSTLVVSCLHAIYKQL